MLSFATEFPVDGSRSARDFLAAVREWLLGSPHTAFEADDLAQLDAAEQWSARKSNELIEVLQQTSANAECAAVRYTKLDRGLDWVSTLVFARASPSGWVGIRTSVESQHPAARLPAAKKPVFVRTFLDRLGGGDDGDLRVQGTAILLANSDVDSAARAISGRAGCRMPVVYVSARFQGGHVVNPASLADQLSGMAHVLVEPNRPFSFRLMQDVSGQNVYGGTVGIYWPDGGGRRSFFLGREFENPAELERAIIEEDRTALTNRRPLARVTWPAVQEQVSRKVFAALREQGSTELDKYIDEFDKELAAKKAALEDAEREIGRLSSEVRRNQAQAPMQAGLSLKMSSEQDFYPGEILGIVRDALADAVGRVPTDSRRMHVLQSLVDANPPTGEAEAMRNQLKTLLRDFRGLDARVRSALKELGFEITEDGKHHKMVFQGDDRYTFTMPKSGSDHRGGLNLAGDISRLLL